jgi:hypothetical protein
MTIITNRPRATKPAPIDLCCKNFDDAGWSTGSFLSEVAEYVRFQYQVATFLISAGQVCSVTRTPLLAIALKPADDIFLARVSDPPPRNFFTLM